MEDDTNSVRDVTASGFTRNEWTPPRQKPYWINTGGKRIFRSCRGRLLPPCAGYLHHRRRHLGYHRRRGTKVMDKLYRFEFGEGDDLLLDDRRLPGDLPVGSGIPPVRILLVTENHRDRERDTANVFTNWQSKDGTTHELEGGIGHGHPPSDARLSPEPYGFLPQQKRQVSRRTIKPPAGRRPRWHPVAGRAIVSPWATPRISEDPIRSGKLLLPAIFCCVAVVDVLAVIRLRRNPRAPDPGFRRRSGRPAGQRTVPEELR